MIIILGNFKFAMRILCMCDESYYEMSLWKSEWTLMIEAKTYACTTEGARQGVVAVHQLDMNMLFT